MATDNWPVDFDYISQRLATEIVQQHEAGGSRYERTWSLLHLVGLAIKKRQPNYLSRFDLAKRATEAVADNTGTLKYPGPYVGGVLDFHRLAFPILMGWEEGYANGKIAVLVSDETTDEGRNFVALFGSIHNYLSRSAPSGAFGGFHPSDADGLYEILESVLESSDLSIDPEWLAEDAHHDGIGHVEAAVRIAGMAAKKDKRPTMRLEYLAKVHHHLRDVDLVHEPFNQILIGAAVWAATPPPMPIGTNCQKPSSL